MTEFSANVEVNLTGDLARNAKKSERAINRMTTRSARNLKKLRVASVGLSNGINKLGNRYTGLISGAGLGIAARGVADFDRRLKDIEVQAGLSTEKIVKLKTALFTIAQAKDVRLDPTKLLAAFDAIIEKTGDFDLAANNLRNIGLAIRATGAQGADIGAVIAGLAKLDITAPKEVAEALELLTEQGKAGAFTMQNMAAEAGPLLAAMASMGQKGMGAVRTLGALAQVTQQATDNAAETSTAIQGLIKEIAVKGKDFEKSGITVFDQKALAEGREEFLALDKIIKSIIARSGGKLSIISKNFGDEAVKALKVSVTDFKNNDQTTNLDQFLGMNGNTGQLLLDAANKATTATAAIESLNAAMQRMANQNLAKPVQDLADAINSIEPEKLNELFDIAGKGVAAAAGIWAVNKAARGVAGGFRAVQAFRGGKGGRGKNIGNALSQATAQPVLVTNWPGANGGSDFAGDGGKGRGKRRKSLTSRGGRGRFGKLSRGLSKLGNVAKLGSLGRGLSNLGGLTKFARVGPVAGVIGAASLGSAAIQGDTRGVVSSGGMLAGGLAGAKLGAIGGSVFGPVGTAVGGLVGGGIGAYAGEEALSSLFDYFKSNKPIDTNAANAKMADALANHARTLADNTNALKDKNQNRPFPTGHADMGGLMAENP